MWPSCEHLKLVGKIIVCRRLKFISIFLLLFILAFFFLGFVFFCFMITNLVEYDRFKSRIPKKKNINKTKRNKNKIKLIRPLSLMFFSVYFYRINHIASLLRRIFHTRYIRCVGCSINDDSNIKHASYRRNKKKFFVIFFQKAFVSIT